MENSKRLSAFTGYGIELEFALVQPSSLQIRSVADLILKDLAGEPVAELQRTGGGWSKELARHVIELKTNGVAADLRKMKQGFQSELKDLEPLLAKHDAVFLGCGMHPLMDPKSEGELWPDDDREIYEAYDRIFNCHGHGWTNLQSIHINLPFANDEEFGRLHAAVRLVLPLLPALASASPLVEGVWTPLDDNRLAYYIRNQSRIPEITGPLMPEAVFTRADYEREILQKTYEAIKAHDPSGILQEEWLNSRGAIARFDRNAIEIRLIDKQESLTADFAVISAVIALVKALYEERWSSFQQQCQITSGDLRAVFDRELNFAASQPIENTNYLTIFGKNSAMRSMDLWRDLCPHLASDSSLPEECFADLAVILSEGNLSRRLRRTLGPSPSKEDILKQYQRFPSILQSGDFYR